LFWKLEPLFLFKFFEFVSFQEANILTWCGVDSIAIAPGAAEHSCCCVHTAVAVVFICVVQDADAVVFSICISHAISG
jgi:hypothetical protein